MPKVSKSALTPKLRFPEFRNDREWEQRILGDEGEFLSPLTGKSAEHFGVGEAKYITYMNVLSNTFADMNSLGTVDVRDYERQNRILRGDVLFTVSSETPDEAGMSSVVLEERDACYLNSFCTLFRFFEHKRPNSRYIGYFLRQPTVRKYLSERAQGSTRYNLSKAAFRSLPILVPSPAEQQKIAECLSTLDELIEAESRKLDALRDYKKGLMQQLFPREGETRPRLRFPEFRSSPDWTTRRMNEIYAFLANNSFSRDRLNYVSGSIKNIHYGDIHKHYRLLFDVTREVVPYINDDALASESQPVFCAEGDMVFADASEDLEDIGKCIEIVNLNNERVVAGLHTILARPKTRSAFARGFSGYLFSSKRIRAQIQKESQGTKVLGISAKRLANIELCFPVHVAEQERIADCLSSLDDLIAAQSERLEALRAHKRGLMQQLFPNPSEFES